MCAALLELKPQGFCVRERTCLYQLSYSLVGERVVPRNNKTLAAWVRVVLHAPRLACARSLGLKIWMFRVARAHVVMPLGPSPEKPVTKTWGKKTILRSQFPLPFLKEDPFIFCSFDFQFIFCIFSDRLSLL